MANQADKKSVERVDKAVIYKQIFLACSALLAVSVIISMVRKTFIFKDVMILGVTSIIGNVSSKQIIQAIGMGVTAEGIFDIFVINCVAQVLYSFTRFGWMVYLLIPFYFLFKCFGSCWGWMGTDYNARAKEEAELVDPKQAKKEKKLEKKMNRPKVVKID